MSKLAFYHINKCGGTSLLSFFMSITDADRVVRLENNKRFEDGRFSVALLDEIFRSEFIHDPCGAADWKAVFGNVHNVLWLRNPVDRLASQIRMIARWTDQEAVSPTHPNWALRDLAREGIQAFVSSELMSAHATRFNGITSFLQLGDAECLPVWNAKHLKGYRDMEQMSLEKALSNVEKMDFIGFVETFYDDFKNLKDMIGRSYSDSISHLNKNPSSLTSSITPEERDLLRSVVALDEKVYLHALGFMGKKHQVAESATGGKSVDPFAEHARIFKGPLQSMVIDSSGCAFVNGWHPCEVNGSRHSRWTGVGGGDALVVAHIDKRSDLRIRFRVVDVNSAECLNMMKVFVDDFEVSCAMKVLPNNELVFEGFAQRERLRQDDDLLWIKLQCGHPERSRQPSDDRDLGLCISEIEIGPEEKYTDSDVSRLPVRAG
jgi:hypothetical protein